MTALSHALAVFRKEFVDALRDRRTLLVVLASSVLLGPLLLLALSGLIASLEAKAEQREVVVVGIENGPSLRNYFERQTWVIKVAPSDYERLLRDSKLADRSVMIVIVAYVCVMGWNFGILLQASGLHSPS